MDKIIEYANPRCHRRNSQLNKRSVQQDRDNSFDTCMQSFRYSRPDTKMQYLCSSNAWAALLRKNPANAKQQLQNVIHCYSCPKDLMKIKEFYCVFLSFPTLHCNRLIIKTAELSLQFQHKTNASFSNPCCKNILLHVI